MMKHKSIIHGTIQPLGDRWRPGDNTTGGSRVTKWGVHWGMVELLFLAYWDGNDGNKYKAVKWAVDFIFEHQDLGESDRSET